MTAIDFRTKLRKEHLIPIRTLILSAAAALCCAALPADGIGPQIRFIPIIPAEGQLEVGAACSMKFDAVPFYISLSTDFNVMSKGLGIFAAADYWIMNPRISGCWKWFFGAGIMAGAYFDGKNVGISAAPRAFLGMNLFFFDGYLELYAQQAVQPEARTALGADAGIFGQILFPSDLGVRFWF